MKHICILFCGGTIAMKKDKNGSLFPFYHGKQLVDKVEQLQGIAHIKVKDITNIDSTNFQPRNWTQLAQAIKDLNKSYDGFVIVHGTDTMAYSASALSFALQNFRKPIVFTGSQIPIDEITSDGKKNLFNAVSVAGTDVPEVSIVFGSKILRGVRATKISSDFDAFDSPMEKPIGEIHFEPKVEKTNLQNRKSEKLKFQPKFNDNIFSFALYPGLQKKYLEIILKSNCEGLILEGFGAGNIPDEIIPVFQLAQKKNIPLVVLSQCNKGMTQMQLYQVGLHALEAGAIPGGDMTTEAAVTKLMWVLAQTKNMSEIRNYFNKSLVGEMTEKK